MSHDVNTDCLHIDKKDEIMSHLLAGKLISMFKTLIFILSKIWLLRKTHVYIPSKNIGIVVSKMLEH